jgi:hypothetical protein
MEAREARMLGAVLQAAVAARPGEPAPASVRLATLIAPRREIRPAALGTAAFFVMVGLAWSLVVGATDLRVENSGPARFSAWPEKRVGGTAGARALVPAAPAGVPVRDVAGVSLIVDLAGVQLAQEQIVPLSGGHLDESLDAAALKVQDVLRPFRSGDGKLELFVLCHRQVPMRTVSMLLTHIDRQQSNAHYQLVIERNLARRESGKKPVQAGLSLRVDAAGIPLATPVRLRIGDDKVKIDGRVLQPFEVAIGSKGWRDTVRESVRRSTGLGRMRSEGGVVEHEVAVSAEGDVAYDRFVAVVAAADSACPDEEDCGLPGLGLQFVLTP